MLTTKPQCSVTHICHGKQKLWSIFINRDAFTQPNFASCPPFQMFPLGVNILEASNSAIVGNMSETFFCNTVKYQLWILLYLQNIVKSPSSKFLSLGTRSCRQQSSKSKWGLGDHNHFVCGYELLDRQGKARRCTVIINQPISILLFPGMIFHTHHSTSM